MTCLFSVDNDVVQGFVSCCVEFHRERAREQAGHVRIVLRRKVGVGEHARHDHDIVRVRKRHDAVGDVQLSGQGAQRVIERAHFECEIH